MNIINDFFIEEPFVDNNIKDVNTIIYSLKNGIPVYNLFIICIEETGNNIAQIISSKQFLKNAGKGRPMKVIGIAYGKWGAEKLLADIFEYWISIGRTIYEFKENIVKEIV